MDISHLSSVATSYLTTQKWVGISNILRSRNMKRLNDLFVNYTRFSLSLSLSRTRCQCCTVYLSLFLLVFLSLFLSLSFSLPSSFCHIVSIFVCLLLEVHIILDLPAQTIMWWSSHLTCLIPRGTIYPMYPLRFWCLCAKFSACMQISHGKKN